MAFAGGGPAEAVLPFLVFAVFDGLASVLFSTASRVGPTWDGLELGRAGVFLGVVAFECRGAVAEEAARPAGPAGAA